MNIKKLLITAGVVIGTAGISGTALAQDTVDQVVSATMLAPISLTQTTQMSFANTATSAAEQTITATSAVYTVSGADNGFSIDTSGSDIALSNTAPLSTDTMAFAITADATGTITGGTAEITVGGAVTAAANQAAGTYEGNLQVTVDYN